MSRVGIDAQSMRYLQEGLTGNKTLTHLDLSSKCNEICVSMSFTIYKRCGLKLLEVYDYFFTKTVAIARRTQWLYISLLYIVGTNI